MGKDALGWYDELQERKRYRDREIKGDFYDVTLGENSEIRFQLKKPHYNPYDAIIGLQTEEEIRRRYFYPFMNNDTILFDVGCSQGHYSFPALALGAKVVGFEADKRYGEDLIMNMEFNNFRNFILCQMFICNVSHAKISVDEFSDVDATTIDEFVSQTKIVPTYIKVDVEGAEAVVILGAERTLTEFSPVVFVENHVLWVPGVDSAITAKMKEFGYIHTIAGKLGFEYKDGTVLDNVVYSLYTKRKV